MSMKDAKLVKSALRFAASKGFNPYDSHRSQDAAYATLWRMRAGSK